jgi:hypothetical protein
VGRSLREDLISIIMWTPYITGLDTLADHVLKNSTMLLRSNIIRELATAG